MEELTSKLINIYQTSIDADESLKEYKLCLCFNLFICVCDNKIKNNTKISENVGNKQKKCLQYRKNIAKN